MTSSPKVSRLAVGLTVVGGVIWTVAGAVFEILYLACYPSCGSLVSASGSVMSYPSGAIRDLTWNQFYINLYTVAIGLLVSLIGLKPFRHGERWAWYAILVFVVTGLITGVFDYLTWGGWYTIFFGPLPALLSLVISAKSFIRRHNLAATST